MWYNTPAQKATSKLPRHTDDVGCDVERIAHLEGDDVAAHEVPNAHMPASRLLKGRDHV
jgi:hypothetical protein